MVVVVAEDGAGDVDEGDVEDGGESLDLVDPIGTAHTMGVVRWFGSELASSYDWLLLVNVICAY